MRLVIRERSSMRLRDRRRRLRGPAEAFHLFRPEETLGSLRLTGGFFAGGHDCLDRFGQAFHVPICQPPPQTANNNANAIERDHSLRVYQKISMRESKTEQTPPT